MQKLIQCKKKFLQFWVGFGQVAAPPWGAGDQHTSSSRAALPGVHPTVGTLVSCFFTLYTVQAIQEFQPDMVAVDLCVAMSIDFLSTFSHFLLICNYEQSIVLTFSERHHYH